MSDPMFATKAKIIAMYIAARKGVVIEVLEPTTDEQWAKFEHAYTVAISWFMQA